jgi:electron transport complex protein RnfD
MNSASQTIRLLHVSTPPHSRQRVTLPGLMLSVIVALVPAIAASVIFFGPRALLVIAVCVLATTGTESLLCLIFRKKQTLYNFSAVVSGLLLALSLPPSLPLWMAVAGSVFAIAVTKMAFGGLGHNIVNPALAGRAFLMLSFPAAMSAWTVPAHGSLFGMSRGLDGITAATPLVYFKSAMMSGNFNPLDLQETLVSLFFGNVGGCLGATSALAICVGVMFLFYRGIIRFRAPVSFIGTVFLFFWVFSGADDILSTEAIIVALYQSLCGGMLLGAFFFAADPVTSPMTPLGKIFFGVGCGLLTCLIRKFGGYPDGVCFAILLMNLATPILDKIGRPRHYGEVKRHD